MKIAIIGPGALGCLLAGYFKLRTKEEVWLIDNEPARAKKIRESGIRIDGLSSGSHEIKVDISSEPREVGACDAVIMCVKSYSTEDATKEVKPLVSELTHVVTVQNGIGNVQILNDQFGEERVIAGITNHGSTLVGTGHVRHAGRGETVIGRADGKMLGAVKDIASVLTKAGFETRISKDIDAVIWGKVIINVGINALTAVTRLNNGRLVEYDGTRELLRAAVQEAVRVVKRKRIKLAYDDPIQKVESVCKATAANVSSMLQDVLRGKRTEIDFINGAIVRHAKALGIATPVNEALTNLVRTIEASYDKTVKETPA
jgi:2-dehydropantoate 2-reductase